MGSNTNLKEKEKGFVLVLVLLLLLVVTLIRASAINTTTHEALISGTKRISDQAFYVAEAGVNEFMGRFREGAVGAIPDDNPTSSNWKLFLATRAEKATAIRV